MKNRHYIFYYFFSDLDECEDRTDNCPTNATCINKQFGFDCECSVGFKLDNGICIRKLFSMYTKINIV